MSMIEMHLVYSTMAKEQTEPTEERGEATSVDEAPNVGHAANMFNCILTTQKCTVDKEPLSDGLAQKQNNQYNLRGKGTTTAIELLKQKFKENLLRKINPRAYSEQNTQRKSRKVVSTKIVSHNSKDKTITLETTKQVPSLDTLASLLAMYYNIVDDMKKFRANTSMFKLTNITIQWDILLWALGKTSIGNTTSSDKGSSKSHGTLKYVLNALTMDANTLCPPFLLTFEIFNFNVHICLVDSGASVNVMPLSIAKKVNAKWEKTDAHIIKLKRTNFQ